VVSPCEISNHSAQGKLIRHMPREAKGSRLLQLGLEPELVDRFTDFREGYLGAPEHRILAEAIELYMADRFKKEPEVKARYEAARQKRLGSAGEKIRIVPNGK
jgi:hypothetical protein